MNTDLISQNVNFIEREIEYIDMNIGYNYFPIKIKEKLITSLYNIENFVKKFNDIFLSNNEITFIARCIFVLKKIHIKIQFIYQKIHENESLNRELFFLKQKIEQDFFPAVTMTVKNLKRSIKYQNRLPLFIGVGNERESYYQKIKNELKIIGIKNASKIEKEYFHFLGDHFEEQQMENIDFSSYEGSKDISGLLSWQSVLQLFIEQGDKEDKQIGNSILGVLKKVKPIFIKLSQAHDLKESWKDNDENKKKELDYFDDLSHHFSRQGNREIQQKLLSETPLFVIINEITWDIIDGIEELALGESIVFILGTSRHAIVIQISHLQTEGKFLNYEYKIFNTGLGVQRYHKAEGKYLAYPIIFEKLSKKDFCYPFLASLLKIILKGKIASDNEAIKKFYETHTEFLIEKTKGEVHYNKGRPYSLQKYGTCVYSSITVWINSYLNPTQMQKMKFIKITHAISKQEQLMQHLHEQDCPSDSSNKRKEKEDNNQKNQKKIKTNESLLDAGKSILSRLNNSFNLTFP